MEMSSFEWSGEAQPEGVRPRPKTPGPLSPEVVAAWQPRPADVLFRATGYAGHVNVTITLPTWLGNPSVKNYSEGGEDYHDAELTVPFEALKQLVLEHYRRKMIQLLEDGSGEELEALVEPAMRQDDNWIQLDVHRFALAEEIERALVNDLATALRLQEKFELLFDESYDGWSRRNKKG